MQPGGRLPGSSGRQAGPARCAPAAFWCIVCAGARRQARFRLVGGQSIIERVGNGGLVETFERIAAELGQDAALHGIEVVKTSAHRRHGETELRLVIDKPGGVDVATCERISHKVNAALDGFADPYTLSVESVGLERPLARPSDYERFIGSNVKLKTDITIRGAKTHRGRLLGLRGTNVVLAQTEGELPVPLALIKHANLEYDARADLKKEKRERRHRE